MENRGVDVSLEYNKAFNKDLLVSVRGTFTYAHNEVKARDEAKYLPNKYNSVLGKPVNSVYGLVADGLFSPRRRRSTTRPGRPSCPIICLATSNTAT